MRFNSKLVSISILMTSCLMSSGCSNMVSTPSENPSSGSSGSEESHQSSSLSSVSFAEDVVSDSFSISYSRTTSIANSAEGMLLIQRKTAFNSNISKLQVKWGNDTEPFDNYDCLYKNNNPVASEFEYDFMPNAYIPSEATKIWVLGLSSDDEVLTKGSVGVEKYKVASKLLYEFQVISDNQITTSTPCFYRRTKETFQDIKEESPDSSVIVVNGDIVDESKSANYDSFYDAYNKVYTGETKTEMQIGLGNHEFIVQSEDGTYSGLTEAQLTKMYNDRLSLWEEKTKNTSPYFSFNKNGSEFIFLGTTKMPATLDGNTRADCTLGEEQLTWFKSKVDEAAKSGKPVYVFSHGSLRDTVSGSLTKLNQTWYGYTLQEENKIRDIIKNYPQVMFFSSHSHWSFESEDPYQINADSPSYFNTAAIGYLWQGSGQGEHYNKGTYENGGAQGLYLEVYDNQVVIKGRQFEASDQTSKYWFSNYQVVLPY